jgi:hypothetical protein
MQRLLLTICLSTLFSLFSNAQTGCPGCTVNVPAGLPADTIYLPTLPDGQQGSAYNADVSFRLPKTTTPVNAIDSTTPPGLTLSQFEITDIEGLPPGLYWQLNQSVFNPQNETDGCLRICGTPTESDSFELIVRVKATVFIITQEAFFPLSLYIAPDVSVTDGFSMTDFEGCGSTTVSFTNNVPSGGAEGFEYLWDFGDGTTFEGENPPPHLYDEPGIYTVTYQATVDTVGYILESIRVLEVDCVDQLGFGAPDLYVQVDDPNGVQLFDSSPDVNNTPLPYTFPVGLALGEGNYLIKVIDEDSGLKGGDDDCGMISFNYLSNDTLVAGGLTIVLNIVHPVEEITSIDTVTVYGQPAPPTVNAPSGAETCAGGEPLVLVSSYGAGNQWFLNGEAIDNATEFVYQTTQTGYYQVVVSTPNGCPATSDSVLVEYHPLPAVPVYYNYNNSLRLTDTLALPAEYALQWTEGGAPIEGETGFWYCAMESGSYGLVVTDAATGCTSVYTAAVTYDPAFDCTIGISELAMATLGIFPNPTTGAAWLQLPKPLSSGARVRVWDVAGRLAHEAAASPGAAAIRLDLSQLAAGMFVVEVLAEDFRGVGRVALAR